MLAPCNVDSHNPRNLASFVYWGSLCFSGASVFYWDAAEYLSSGVLSVVGYYLGDLIFRPYNRIVTLGELGYLPDGKFTKKEIANSVKRRRAVGDVPPVYPNGWYGIIESWKLKNGDVTTIHLIGT